MKNILSIAIILTTSVFSFAQRAIRQSDWQQSVDYYINVKLDDVNHTLEGDARYVYTNNSPNELTQLYFHIWPNAYKDNETDFARQQILNGSTVFHFSEDRGRIDKLKFTVDGNDVTWSYYNDQIDICVLTLTNPIKPGQTVEIKTPFWVKIPADFSRFGHKEQGYQITQWYPKPAVYDVNGWNPMPYLDQGEFYSEFGKFEVQITVPENYVVAATGELQEESEKKFIENRIDNPIDPYSPIESATTTKTITYVQDNIHDFAWFADKNFNVSSEPVKLKNGQVVETYVYALEGKSISRHNTHIKTALNYYSDHCGYYSYAHCSVVQGALKAGGGMEYPMITVITHLDEEVIVHEVGHNWFYGILGSNERLYPWMDESINSYFEQEAIHHLESKQEASIEKPNVLKGGNLNSSIMSILSRELEAQEMHQAVGTHSKMLTNNNYGFMVYGKGSIAFDYLKSYLGQATLDKCFKAYFDQWKFKHPLPGDIQDVFETESGKKLDWFFEGLINSEEHIDYKVKSIDDGKVVIENVGRISAPYSLGLFKSGVLVSEKWYEGHEGEREVQRPEGDYDLVKIDPYEVIPEVNRQNNTIRVKGMFKRVEPLTVSFMSLIDNPNATTLSVVPLVGWNKHNGGMFGIWFNNHRSPTQRFSFSASPLYSGRTEDLNGYFNTNYKWFNNGTLNKVQLGVKGSRFAYQSLGQDYSYQRVVPYLKLNFRNSDKRIPKTSILEFTSHFISSSPRFNLDEEINSLKLDTGLGRGRRTVEAVLPNQFIGLRYIMINAGVPNPSSLKVFAEMGLTNSGYHVLDTQMGTTVLMEESDVFTKLNVEYNKHYAYKIPKKGFDVRVFGGVFFNPADNANYHYRLESSAGMWDYTFDQVLMGRGVSEGMFNRQILPNGSFFKEPGSFGNIDQWVVAVNLKSDLPFKLPLGVYLDAFTYNGLKDALQNEKGESFLYNGGLQINVLPDFLEIYVPLFSSSTIKSVQEIQGIENLGQRITFMLNLNLFENKGLNDLLRIAQ